jgi:hypothetical protein
VVILGLTYFVIGVVTAGLSRGPGASQVRVVWRWAAWLLSVVAFASQIWYERIRAAVAPVRAALRAALAVALGGFLLAIAATVHALSIGSARIVPQLVALVAWPLLLGVASFVVALGAASVLGPKQAA